MARANPDGRASNAMVLFLVVNTSSVQLLPTTMSPCARRPERPTGGYRAAHAAGDGGFNRVRRGNLPSSGRGERMSALFLPALCIAVILAGLLARTNVYDAFVRGAEEGLATLIQIAPCLCAILSATALWRETGLLTALTDGLKPVFVALRLPGEAASVVLLRPLSGSAALAAVNRRNSPMRRGQPGGAAGVRHQRG